MGGLCDKSNVALTLTYPVEHFLLDKLNFPDTAHLWGIDDMALQFLKIFHVKSKFINHCFISDDNIENNFLKGRKSRKK